GDDIKPEMLSLLTGLPEDKIWRTTVLLHKIGAVEFRPETRLQKKPPARPQMPAQPPPPKPAEPPKPPPVAPVTPIVKKSEEVIAPAPTPVLNKELEAKRAMKDAEISFNKAEEEYALKNYGRAAHFCKEALNYYQDARYWHLLGISYAQ